MSGLRVLLSSLFVCCCALCWGASFHVFRHYTGADGLPSNCIRDILQDEDGFMWIATDGGLSRFDGVSFHNLSPGDVNKSCYKDPFVSKIVICNHKIWVATIDGLLLYDAPHDNLISPNLHYENDTPPLTGFIRDMAADQSGNLWVAMADGRIYCVDNARAVKCVPTSYGNGRVNAIFVDKRSEVWITGASDNPGLFKFDNKTHSFKRFDVLVDGNTFDLRPFAISEDTRNRLWIGLADGNLICLDPLSGVGNVVPLGANCEMRNIHSITFVKDNEMYIGNDAGVCIYNLDSNVSYLLKKDELQPSSLSGQFVYPVVSDSEGGVWIGTFYAGLNYLPPDIKHFESASESRFVNSVSGNIISSFCEDSFGNIYIGSEDGGVSRLDTNTGAYYKLLSTRPDKASVNVHSLCLVDNDLWVGTYDSGIVVYDCKTGSLRRDLSDVMTSEGKPLIICNTLMLDRQGQLWIASENDIFCYDRIHDCFQMVKTLGAWTTDIKQDNAGNVWFATQGQGLYRFSKHDKKWHQYSYSPEVEGSIICNHVSGIDFDSKNVLWAATDNGLVRYDADSDSYSSVDVVGANQKMMFVKVSGDDLWIGTCRGLVRFSPSSGTSSFFGSADGLADDQFSINAVFRDSSGFIYAGTINGYSRFCPDKIGSNDFVPPMAFTSLDVVGKRVEVGDPRLPLSLNHIKRLDLGPDDNSFSIGFAALSFMNPQSNSYLYRLEGFDKEWMSADDSHKASYTNLAPGDYTLYVKASNNDKVWNEAGIALPIHIAPYWYNTWIARSLYALAILAAAFGVIYLLIARNRKKHSEELDRLKTAKEIEVYEAKLNFFTTVAHEIRTPVSLIVGPLESVMKDRRVFSETQNGELDIIHRNTLRLLVLVNQLLDFRKVESLAVNAKFLPTDIPALVCSVADRFRPSLAQLGIEMHLNLPSDSFKADVDAEALTKLVSNLLNNARKFTNSKISLACNVNPGGDSFVIEVADDGKGISESDLKRIFKPFVQLEEAETNAGGTGLGLSIVNRVVSAHSGKIDVHSNPGKGSSFVVSLPMHQAAVTKLDDIVDEELEKKPVDEIESEIKPNSDEAVIDSPVMLVVDDNPDLITFLSNYFSKDYTVVTAADANEALKHLSAFKVDLIVSDWMMPGMSGVEFCRKIRENRDLSHIPFVLLTAKTDESSKIEGLGCGADAYIEKPFSIDYLAARISNLLHLRSLLKQKFSSSPLEPIESLASNPTDNDFLSQLTALIENNFSNPELSVEFLCRELGISRSGLYAKVRSLTDSTPNELIQITRLKRAAQLISEHRYRIGEICYMVGFSNPSYFSKCFQRQFGMKPGEFNG